MAETAATPPHLVAGKDTSTYNVLKASRINEVRIDSVIERLRNRLHDAAHFNPLECADLCLSLARGIDFCVSNQQPPVHAQQLPLLLKQIFQPKHDALLLAAIMVLMISIKSASQCNWFSEKDAEELRILTNEIGKHFCSSRDINSEPSTSQPIISTIMSRFFPKMRMGQILFVLEAKPGFGAYVKDFRISKELRRSADESVRLLVARTDNAETSACLVSPPQVNFLLNGKGVDRRVNISMDAGPQMPTNVTLLLKFGCNLLQAIGDFNGSYIIVMALVSETSTLSNLEIEDYVQPATALVDPDSDLIEGPSRISLNCPISFKRIKTPAKGQSCKHHQCFDLDNYLGINSKKPSWRCPICNTYVSFTDIRLDKNMAKVLSDIGENVNDVIISSDGSWKAIMEGDDHKEKQREKISGEDAEMSEQLDTAQFLNDSPDLLDLTGLDDEMESVKNIDSVDRKVPHNQDDFWSGMYLSTFPSQTPNNVSDTREGITPDPSPTNAVLPPLSADSNSMGNALVPVSGAQNELSSPTGWQMQQYPFGDVTNNSNEYGWSHLPMSRNVTRTPSAIQALPAQHASAAPGFHRQRNSGMPWVQTGPPANAAPVIGDGFHGNPRSMEGMTTQLPRSHPSSMRVPHMAGSSLQQPPHLNSNGLYKRPFNSISQSQPITGGLLVPNQRPSGGQFQSASQPFSQAQGVVVQGGARGVTSPRMGQQIQGLTAAQRAAQGSMGYQASRTTGTPPMEGGARMPRAGGSTVTGVAVAAAFEDLTGGGGGGGGGDQNWRPTGRMRGSLQGQAYSEALNLYAQPAQPMRPSPPSLPPFVASSPIQMANRTALHEANCPTGLSSVPSPSGVLPQKSPRLN